MPGYFQPAPQEDFSAPPVAVEQGTGQRVMFTPAPPHAADASQQQQQQQQQLSSSAFSVLAPPALSSSSTDAALVARVSVLCDLVRSKDLLQFARQVSSWRPQDCNLVFSANLAVAGVVADGTLLAPKSTFMHFLVATVNEPFLRESLKHVHVVNTVEDANGETALTLAFAAQRTWPLIPMLLVAACSSPLATLQLHRLNSKGRSLLHTAVTAKTQAPHWPDRLPIVQYIVEHGGLPAGTTDARGLPAAAWARVQLLGDEAPQVIKYLEANGGAVAANPDAAGGGAGGSNGAGSLSKGMTEDEAALAASTPHSFRSVFRNPLLRILTVMVLMLLHCLQYCVDRADRVTTPDGTSHPPANFAFVYNVLHVLTSNWSNLKGSGNIAAKIGCICIGCLVGVALSLLLVRYLLLQLLLKVKMVGYGTTKVKWRGAMFFILAGGYVGIFGGSKLFNYFLDRYEVENRQNLYSSDVFVGSTNISAMRTFWTVQLVLDWYIFILILDTMVQQATRRIALPHIAYASFLSSWHGSLRAFRLVLFWIIFTSVSVGVVLLMHTESVSTDARTVESSFGTPFIGVSHDAQLIVVPALSMLFIALVAAQDWSLPNCAKRRMMAAPGIPSFGLSCNTTWWLWFVLLVNLALDIRIFYVHIEYYFKHNDVHGSDQLRFLLFLATLPAGLAAWVVLATVGSTSGWCFPQPNEEDDETLDEEVMDEERRQRRSSSVLLQQQQAEVARGPNAPSASAAALLQAPKVPPLHVAPSQASVPSFAFPQSASSSNSRFADGGDTSELTPFPEQHPTAAGRKTPIFTPAGGSGVRAGVAFIPMQPAPPPPPPSTAHPFGLASPAPAPSPAAAQQSTLEWFVNTNRKIHPALQTHGETFGMSSPNRSRGASPLRAAKSLGVTPLPSASGAAATPGSHFNPLGFLESTLQKASSVMGASAAPPPTAGYTTAATDIFTAAFLNDVALLRDIVARDPTAVNARGGCGLVCSAGARQAFLNVDPTQVEACAACPIHYAVASNSRAAITLLLAKGANPKLRTSSGLFNAKELAAMCGHVTA